MLRKIILMAILGAVSMQTKAQYDTYINQMMYQEQILANERYERYAEILRAANEVADAMALRAEGRVASQQLMSSN